MVPLNCLFAWTAKLITREEFPLIRRSRPRRRWLIPRLWLIPLIPPPSRRLAWWSHPNKLVGMGSYERS